MNSQKRAVNVLDPRVCCGTWRILDTGLPFTQRLQNEVMESYRRKFLIL